jgi:hypothetical protein
VWSLSGASCPLACGSVDASGNYTAPRIIPLPATNITKTPTGFGIRLTPQISAGAAPSARTLFIQNTNSDKIAASGTLWLQ